MTLMKVPAVDSNSQGHMAIEIMRPMYDPRRVLMYFGNNSEKSIPAEKALSMTNDEADTGKESSRSSTR